MNDTQVKIVEVGPRDGLQNEPNPISAEDKISLINELSLCGFQEIESASFVSPKWVPQMASSDAVMKGIQRAPNTVYSALTPNLKGLEAAIDCKTEQVAIFAAASEAFSQRNINCSISESIERFKPLMERAKDAGVQVRGYVSVAMGCPYQKDVPLADVIRVSEQLIELGCFEVSIGDTIGTGTAFAVKDLINALEQSIPLEKLAMHFHDTYGQAVANTATAYEHGIRVFDASVAGLGGCPYAKGATGNVATEDVVYLFERSGIATGIDLDALVTAGNNICQKIGRTNNSNAANALLAQRT